MSVAAPPPSCSLCGLRADARRRRALALPSRVLANLEYGAYDALLRAGRARGRRAAAS